MKALSGPQGGQLSEANQERGQRLFHFGPMLMFLLAVLGVFERHASRCQRNVEFREIVRSRCHGFTLATVEADDPHGGAGAALVLAHDRTGHNTKRFS